MKSYSVTDVGQKRQVNQDYVFASEEPVGNLPNLFVVADGMGGRKESSAASDVYKRQGRSKSKSSRRGETACGDGGHGNHHGSCNYR